jgi:hypothetical protein
MKLMSDKLHSFVVTLGKTSMLREQTSSVRLVEAYEVDDKLKSLSNIRVISDLPMEPRFSHAPFPFDRS